MGSPRIQYLKPEASRTFRRPKGVTNEYEHNGLRASPAVFERLLALRGDLV